MALGVLLFIGAAVAVAYPIWWNNRSKEGGKSLIVKFHDYPAQPATHCTLPSKTAQSSEPAGIVSIPSLSMQAPVLQGLTDPVLNVAAGHDVASPWPGGLGESVLESHDVSYFSNISSLKNGDYVDWLDHCQQLTFKVIGHLVTGPGTMLYPPPSGRGLALITCYPTDVLFFVPTRYVLLTQLVSIAKAKTTPKPVQVVLPHLKVPAPPDLVAQGLNLQQNAILLGTMHLSGSPSPGWRQGPASLDLEALALESYFGAQKAIGSGNQTWWKDLAEPGLAMPQAWSSSADVYVNEDIAGNNVQSVTLSSQYVSFKLVPVNGDLLIKSITFP
jgi:LPXTG-site transpeptidase (sortase) family protein